MTLVTEEQVKTLRAHLRGDREEYERLWSSLDRDAARTGYTALVTAAFVRSVEMRFGRVGNREAVVEFIGRMRARFAEEADRIDPVAAERLILSVVGDESTAGIDRQTKLNLQVLLLSILVEEREFSDAELDEFLNSARSLGDQLMR